MQKFMVGGAVRDKLMGIEPKDVDFVVIGSTPEEMLAAGFQKVGADFPVFLDADGVEHALARTERKSGHGYNGFTTHHGTDVTLEDDLMRRDLTINAMAMDGDEIIDPFGGQDDIKNKILRHVSPAFADDPVRVLRLARFHARFGPEWLIHTDTVIFSRQIAKSGELKHLTRERVLNELEKALAEPYPKLFFDTLQLCHALNEVLPELSIDSRDMDFALSKYTGGSSKFNYAMLSNYIKDIEQFESRLNVSVEWRKFSKMFRTIFAIENEYIHPVSLLYRMDAFRQHGIWGELIEDFNKTGFIDYVDDLVKAYNKTKHINFSSLSSQQQSLLKGSEISNAIMQLRIKSI